jgi:hypothetical protein
MIRHRTVLGVLLLWAFCTSAHAGFVGQTFTATYRLPDVSTVYPQVSFSIDPFTVGEGLDTVGNVEGVTEIRVNFTDDRLIVVFATELSNPLWSTAAYNGVLFELQSPGTLDISAASVSPATTMVGFDDSRVLLTPTSIGLNWNALGYTTSTRIEVDFGFAPAAVPEPASLAMVAGGLGLFALFLIRRRIS